MKAGWVALGCVALTASSSAQQARPIGSVASADATVTRQGGAAVQVAGGKSEVSGNASVTAKAGRNAEVALARGGSLLVCQTTGVHLTPSADDSLLLALDRGAMEIRARVSPKDVVMTPDLRFTMAQPGTLDLRLRVSFNGDTCVENRGRKSPPLNVSDAFGETAYLLKPGQHVMFEHGNLHTVEDRETTPCGCPPDEKTPAGMSLADALLSGGRTEQRTPAQQAAAEHPFPEAVSEGLAAPAPPSTPEAPGEPHVQVSTALQFDPSGGSTEKTAEAPAAVAAAPAPAAPAAPEQKPGAFAAIGRFFKRIFVR
jgi:hypothetical protein